MISMWNNPEDVGENLYETLVLIYQTKWHHIHENCNILCKVWQLLRRNDRTGISFSSVWAIIRQPSVVLYCASGLSFILLKQRWQQAKHKLCLCKHAFSFRHKNESWVFWKLGKSESETQQRLIKAGGTKEKPTVSERYRDIKRQACHEPKLRQWRFFVTRALFTSSFLINTKQWICSVNWRCSYWQGYVGLFVGDDLNFVLVLGPNIMIMALCVTQSMSGSF
jgi:hypothetical protein